jgi:ribosomal protein S18 acetylase RimI-like enzyme
MCEYVIEEIDEPARLWLQTRRLGEKTIYEGTICRAVEGEEEIGRLAIDSEGIILHVEVVPRCRRRGIATEMYRRLEDAGLAPQHDWKNMTPAAADWAASLEE